MTVHELAGRPAPQSVRANIPRLIRDYYLLAPDPREPTQGVAFGTSGHRGSAHHRRFNQAHILAITQAICEYRAAAGIRGPLFLGMDTHGLSEPSHATALEVLAANGVTVCMAQGEGYTPTPVISHAILSHNRQNPSARADGIVITPSHNPPEDGGFKYNPPHGGPAGADVTQEIQDRANAILKADNQAVKQIPYSRALRADTTCQYDYITPFVADLKNVVDMAAIARAGVRIAVDPLGGAGVDFWDPIAEQYGLNLTVSDRTVDPCFAFMPLDKDGRIRMDCSSAYAMSRLIALKDQYDIAFGNDPDVDRHGIVTASQGLMNPNHYLAVAIAYLFENRPNWPSAAMVGKTLVSSGLIDRVAADLGRQVAEVPVGFKWFVEGLSSGQYGFGGEESAGAAFLRMDGTVWTTDKDGIILGLLAAEITAKTGRDPAEQYQQLAEKFGEPCYQRLDAPATPEQKAVLKTLSPDAIPATTLAGEPIVEKLSHAPGNGAPIGGVKVCAANGWFAARPSGTEDIYKIYTESFKDKAHLARIQEEAQAMVSQAFAAAGV